MCIRLETLMKFPLSSHYPAPKTTLYLFFGGKGVREYRTEWKGLVRLPPAEQHRGPPIPTADDFTSLFVPHKNLPPTNISPRQVLSRLLHFRIPTRFLSPRVSYCSILVKKIYKGVVTFLTCNIHPHPLILLYPMHTTQLAQQLRPCYGGGVGFGVP